MRLGHRVEVAGLSVAGTLHDIIAEEALPGLQLGAEHIWTGFAAIIAELSPLILALLARRDKLRASIDKWLATRRGQPFDSTPRQFSALPAHPYAGHSPLTNQTRHLSGGVTKTLATVGDTTRMQTNPIWGIALAGTVLLGGCTAATSEDAAAARGELFYIGTQDTQKQLPGALPQQGPPVDLRPGGKGIYAARLNPATGALTPLGLVAGLERPTWLVASPDRPVLYSVSETGNDGKSEATIHSFSITADTGALHVMNMVSSGGGGATHMAIDPAGQTIFVANFGDGHVAALPVNQDGSLAPPSSVQSDFGTGPTPRQQRPHAHSVALDPSGHFLLAADLGADRIFVYRFDASTHTLSPAHPAFVAVPPGSGPRHLAFTPDGRTVYMDTELAAEIIAFRWNAAEGSLMKIQALPISTPGFAGEKSAAELAVSKNGRFVYVSNRGENLVEVLTVDAATGMLSELQRTSAGALTPWSFTIDPTGQWMVVCNQGSSQLDVLKIDPATGLLSATGQSLDVPKPVNVTFPLYK